MSIETLPRFVSSEIRADYKYTVEIQDNKDQYWLKVTRKDGKMRHAESQIFNNEAEREEARVAIKQFVAGFILQKE